MNNGIVRNWMSTPVITVKKDTHLSEARRLMNLEKIRALPVVDHHKLVGIITRRGLLRFDLSSLDVRTWEKKYDLKDEVVGDIMTVNPLTTTPASFIPKAARVMLENKVNALPVTENTDLKGIITSSDLLRFIIKELPLLKKNCTVGNYMTDEVVSIEKETSLLEAHRLMGTKRIRSLPVLENGDLVGLVTRTDLMSSDPSRLGSKNNQELSLKILTQSVEQVMTKSLITVSPETSLLDAAGLMLNNKIHCLPVLDPDNKLAGIITESDLFLMILQKFS